MMLMIATCFAHGIVEHFTIIEIFFGIHPIYNNGEEMLKMTLITLFFSIYYNYNVIMVFIMSSFITKEVI